MNLRPLFVGAAVVALTVGILPASTAFAQDDVTCVQEETRQTTEGFHSTVVHFCARWQWHPPSSTGHDGTDPGDGDHDPDGGKGGTPDKDCDAVKQALAEAAEQIELVAKQLDATESWLTDVMGREATARQAGYTATDAWQRAANDVDFWLTMYLGANDVDVEVESSPKHGVTIVRPVASFRPNRLLDFGIELEVAMHREALARVARDKAATEYEATGTELIDAQAAYNNLLARLSALAQTIERLQSRRC